MRTIAALFFLSFPLQASPAFLEERFQELQALIQPQADEFAWYEEIPWRTSLKQALEDAVAEGKPVLVWCSADGQPCGAT